MGILDATPNALDLVIALLAAFWTGTSAVFGGMQLLIARRDVIIAGKLDGAHIAPAERLHMLRFEWAMIRGALGAVSLMLGVVILALPRLSGLHGDVVWICISASVVPFGGALFFLVGGVFDYRHLARLVAR